MLVFDVYELNNYYAHILFICNFLISIILSSAIKSYPLNKIKIKEICGHIFRLIQKYSKVQIFDVQMYNTNTVMFSIIKICYVQKIKIITSTGFPGIYENSRKFTYISSLQC